VVNLCRRTISATAQSRTPNNAIPWPSTVANDGGCAPVLGTGGVGADATSIVTDDTLLPGTGSVWVSPDFVAVLMIAPSAASFTVICRVAEAPSASAPIVQSPLAAS
jgi:hypothetical protein